MANEVDDIVTNIVLAGNNEVIEAFDKIREAGTRAFESIEQASERLGGGEGAEKVEKTALAVRNAQLEVANAFRALQTAQGSATAGTVAGAAAIEAASIKAEAA